MTAALTLARYWREIGIGLLLAVIAFMAFRADAISAERDAAVARGDAEVAKHSVTRASLDRVKAALDDKNRESEARAKAYADSKAGNDADQRRLDAVAKADESRIAFLRGLAASPSADCTTPPALAEALKGL